MEMVINMLSEEIQAQKDKVTCFLIYRIKMLWNKIPIVGQFGENKGEGGLVKIITGINSIKTNCVYVWRQYIKAGKSYWK
jgi:hypothetical protein